MSADATQFLGHGPQAGSRPAADPDAQATQYLPPVPAEPDAGSYGIRPGAPDERQPPAEFDNLFRSDSAGASSTQQLPQFQPPAAGAPGAPGGRAAARRAAGDEGAAAVAAPVRVCRSSPPSAWASPCSASARARC
uniref:Uncharacterized protein n=1 Tax=Streptomyces avermitilis TaxID=33903 RepID=A0A499VDV1_STRAX|nr:hypothetical protein SAVMC3_44210 [Streptomyces avermitilis]